MNIRNAIGTINLTVDSPVLTVQVELGGIETEMTDITPKEYLEILKAKNEMSKQGKEMIQNVIGGLKEAIEGSTPTKKQESEKTSEEALEELMSQLPFLKNAKVIKVNPKEMNNPFGPGGIFGK